MKQQFFKDKYIKFYLEAARAASKLSHAQRLKVGALIVKDDNILAYGYNGTPKGRPNRCETEDGSTTLPDVIHAELNAILKMAKSHNSCEGAAMFLTHSPCEDCAKYIYQAGIELVFFETKYRSDAGIKWLREAGVRMQEYVAD